MKWLCIGLPVLLWALPCCAEEGNTAEYKFQYYVDNNGVKVLSHDAGAGLKIGDHVKVRADYLVDAITAASRSDHRGVPASALPKTDAVTSATSSQGVDGVTHATTDETRQQFTGTVSLINDYIKHFRSDKNNDDPTTMTFIGSYSGENDYISRTIGAVFAQDLFQRNTTLSFTFGKSFDQWNPISWAVPGPDNAGWNYLGSGKRETSRYSVGMTQGITTTTIASVNGEYVYDVGYLAKPYNSMLINGTYYHENYPAQHKSLATTGLLNQYIPVDNSVLSGISLHGEYRYYHDSWSITSHTGTAELYVRLFNNYVARPSYRYYWQSAPFFYQDSYATVPVYLTTDLKYRAGNSQTVGLKLSWEVVDFVKPMDDSHFPLFLQSIDIAGNYYMRQSPASQDIVNLHYGYWNAADGYHMFWLQTGLKFAF